MTKLRWIYSLSYGLYLSMQDALGPNDLFKEMLAHMGINGRQGVIQQVDIFILVHCSGQRDTLLLASTQVDALQGID